MKVIGIDPGVACTGFGIIKVINNNLNIIDYGVIKTNQKELLNIRLNTIYQDLRYIIEKYKPEVMSVEEIFYGKISCIEQLYVKKYNDLLTFLVSVY